MSFNLSYEIQLNWPALRPRLRLINLSDGEPGQSYRVATKAEEEGESRFQYILAAPTSIVTKTGEPSLTYINQGQSYEIKIKKLGDISGIEISPPS